MDEVTRKWFDARSVTVRRPRELEGWHSDEEVTRLAGAPSGSIVTASITGEGCAELRVEHDMLLAEPMVRRIVQEANGFAFHLVNHAFVLRSPHQRVGIGARSIAIEVLQAKRLGYFSRIRTFAVGDFASAQGGSPLVGYWVWPKLGFDAMLPEEIRGQPGMPLACRECRTVLQLNATMEGAGFWRRHGRSMWLEFDLRDGSASWSAFHSYLVAQRIKVMP